MFGEKAKASLKRSAVADNDSGESKLSEVRTSSGTFIPKAKVRSFSLSLCFPSLILTCLYVKFFLFSLFDHRIPLLPV